MRDAPQIGDIVEIVGIDCAGFTNTATSKATPPAMICLGVLVEEHADWYKLQTGFFPDDAEDPDGDFTTVPKWAGQRVRVLYAGYRQVKA